jgi:hypothetical protein
MRASPAFQVVLDRFGMWQAAVFTAVLAGALVMLAWLASEQPSLSVASRWGIAGIALGLLLRGAAAARVRAVSLRWDGQLWHLGPPGSAGHEPDSGPLHVAIDLGPWMLLRLEPAASTWGSRSIWLPAQRHGLEAHWHALRCAVYSPRPAPGTDAVADF